MSERRYKSKILDDLFKRGLKINWYLANPEKVYIEWFYVPELLQRQGIGTLAYEEWEKELPESVHYVSLHAADRSDPFWDRLGFNWQWDFGYQPDVSDDRYEDSHAMVKGVHGARTPKTRYVGDE
jgi:GNAT superfamily N-acetyltransferase